MDIIPLPAFQDNYIWLMRAGRHAAVVDPGDADVVHDYLAREGLTLSAVLITHHHHDHTGGIVALLDAHPAPVFGPAAPAIAGVDHLVGEGDRIALPALGTAFEVLAVPGHTASHIAFYNGEVLFPGDTLFSAGCGRLLGGSAPQLHRSLQRLAALPGDTGVYCTHEYTLANLAFACAAEPDNTARDAWLTQCHARRQRGEPTLPTHMARERDINPFLRVEQAGIIDTVAAHTGARPADALACFTALRAWKDGFRG